MIKSYPFKRVVSVCLLLALIPATAYPASFNKDITTLSPSLRFAPVVTNEDFTVAEKGLEELSLSAGFKEYVGFVYLSIVIGKVIERFGGDISIESFRELIEAYGPKVEFIRFDPAGFKRDGDVFSMSYKRSDGSRLLVNYCMKNKLPMGIAGKPVAIGTGDVCVFVKEAEAQLVTPVHVVPGAPRVEIKPEDKIGPAGDIIIGLLDKSSGKLEGSEARIFFEAQLLCKKLEDDTTIQLTDREFLDLLEVHALLYTKGLSRQIGVALIYAIRNRPDLFSVIWSAMQTMKKTSVSPERMGSVFAVYESCFSSPVLSRKATQDDLDFVDHYFDGYMEYHYWRRILFHKIIQSNPDLKVTKTGIKFMREALLEEDGSPHAENFFRRFAKQADILPYIATEGMPDLALAPDALSGVEARGNGPAFERLEREEPSIYNLLFNPDNARKLMLIATTLRKIYPYTKLEEIRGLDPPFAKALKEGIYFHLGNNVYISPYTESFRRHVIFRMDEAGRVDYSVEIKIPGEMENKKKIEPGDYEFSRTVNGFYPDLKVTHPLAFISYPFRKIDLYGSEIEYDPEKAPGDSCNMLVFELDDGRRLSSLTREDLGLIVEKYPDKYGGDTAKAARDITLQVLKFVAIFHSMEYAGTDSAGTDMHLNNFKLILDEDGPQVNYCGDFGEDGVDFLSRGKYMSSDVSNIVKGVMRRGAVRYYGLPGLFGSEGPGEEECFNIYREELEKAKAGFRAKESLFHAQRVDSFLKLLLTVWEKNNTLSDGARNIDGSEWPVTVTDNFIRCGNIVYMSLERSIDVPDNVLAQYVPETVVLDVRPEDLAAAVTPYVDAALLMQSRQNAIRGRNVLDLSGSGVIAFTAGRLGAKKVMSYVPEKAMISREREAQDVNWLDNCLTRSGDPSLSEERVDVDTILSGPLVSVTSESLGRFPYASGIFALNVPLSVAEGDNTLKKKSEKYYRSYEVFRGQTDTGKANIIVRISDEDRRLSHEARVNAASLVTSIRKKAMEASAKNEKILIAMDTSWMPEGAGLPELLAEMCKVDKEKGLENVIMIKGKTTKLAGDIADTMERERSALPKANVLVIAENGFLDSTALDFLKSERTGQGAFFVGIDPVNFKNDMFDGRASYVRLFEILRRSISAAFAGDISSLEKMSGAETSRPNGHNRWLIVPAAEREEIDVLRARYERELSSLHSA